MEKKYQKILKNYLVAIFILASFLAGLFIGKINSPKPASSTDVTGLYSDELSGQDFSLFWKVWDIVDAKFILKPVDQTKLLYGAIKGMIESLDDPYSSYMDPEETKSFKEQLSGNFEGIGAELTTKDSVLTIVSVLKGSPAEAAGLKDGDAIIKINDEDSLDLSIYEAVSKIRGEKGTQVVLTIGREGEDNPIDIAVTRDTINIPSVTSEIKEVNGKNILYLEISTFAENTSAELAKEIEKNGSAVDGVLIDLRGNTGGLLSQAVEVAERFLSKDSLVAIESFSDEKEREFRTSKEPIYGEVPVVVLVNGSSASASEILAGALRDQRGVALVGVKTFGKGTVQEYSELGEEGGSLRVSVAKWLTPNRTDINKQGLEPDILIEKTDDESDNQLDRALQQFE